MNKLKGYKTYAICTMMVLYALTGVGLGHIDGNEALRLFLEAMALAGLRNAI